MMLTFSHLQGQLCWQECHLHVKRLNSSLQRFCTGYDTVPHGLMLDGKDGFWRKILWYMYCKAVHCSRKYLNLLELDIYVPPYSPNSGRIDPSR
jgi:hypothetical protein